MFQIHDRIVCIDDSPPRRGNTTDNPLQAGSIYNVTEYEAPRWLRDVLGVRVTGSWTFNRDGTEVHWNALRFRKYGDIGGVNCVTESEPAAVC
jgi:hypothetical protein